MFLKPFLSESKKIITVKISETNIGIAPRPAPFESAPKKVTKETILHKNHVKG
jgi:hypothetical protein